MPGYPGPWRLIYATALDATTTAGGKGCREQPFQNHRFLPLFHSYVNSVSMWIQYGFVLLLTIRELFNFGAAMPSSEPEELMFPTKIKGDLGRICVLLYFRVYIIPQ